MSGSIDCRFHLPLYPLFPAGFLLNLGAVLLRSLEPAEIIVIWNQSSFRSNICHISDPNVCAPSARHRRA